MSASRYFLFLDESGNHGLTEINPNSSVFLLCGVLFQENDYQVFRHEVNKIKSHFWGTKEVIFHSRDIRKCQKEFSILLNLDIKAEFYKRLNKCVSGANFTAFGCAIRKDEYIKKFGRLSNDVYELSLSFIIERTIFFFDTIKEENKKLDIVIEERGKKEDNKLREHFQRLIARGTGYVSAARLNSYGLAIHYRNKKKNINGLQLSDLVAYPCATHVNNPGRANPAFDLIKEKIYSRDGNMYGLKVYP